ncbi:hypothetical protein HAX54_005867, partial [Datura stramonium]|nr:hypothetical protein [Datura stramonium]
MLRVFRYYTCGIGLKGDEYVRTQLSEPKAELGGSGALGATLHAHLKAWIGD